MNDVSSEDVKCFTRSRLGSHFIEIKRAYIVFPKRLGRIGLANVVILIKLAMPYIFFVLISSISITKDGICRNLD